MNNEVVRPTEKYYLHGLDLDRVWQMRDIADVCLQFMERGHRVLEKTPYVVPLSPTSFSINTAFVPCWSLEQSEVDELARAVWDENEGQLGVSTIEKMKALGGLWLCLISAIQQAGVPETRHASIRVKTHSPRAWMVNYFYGEVGNQLVQLEAAGFSKHGLAGFRTRIEDALITTVPSNGWWEKSA